jgi:hypothetical protein
MNPLQRRLAVLRRRLRYVVTFRALAWLLALLLFAAALGGLVDWRMHLPGIVRACVLTGTLGGAGFIAYRYLLQPLIARADDLSLALLVESQFPALNDALASAVQFLEEPTESEALGSPSLRQAAVRHALELARGYDFSPVVDARGTPSAGLALAGSGTLAVALALLFPAQAGTALLRLADPFGRHDWPRQTQLTLEARSRAARGEAFTIQGRVRGLIPVKATIAYQFDGTIPVEQVCDITCTEDSGHFTARLDPARVQHNFRFQVRANDALSGWKEVEVLPPPQLVPLDGRASPQIHVCPPEYTALPALNLPDGTSTFEVVAGSTVSVRAAVDRPVVRAWLEYPLELEPIIGIASELSALGTLPPTRALELAGARQRVWSAMPAHLSDSGHIFALEFVARVGGTFALRFQDDNGLETTRLLEVHVVTDPPPTVNLQRPSHSEDTLTVLPDAEVTLQVRVEDPIFAVRGGWLEYHIKRGTELEPAAEVSRLGFYDHKAAEQMATELLTDTALAPLRPQFPVRLRPQRLDLGRRWPLRPLQLYEGDVVTLQAVADDFDDVTVGKLPGRSHEIELRVVGRPILEQTLNDAQAQIQQELLRLHKLQQDALQKVIPAEAHWRNNQGRLQPQHLDELLQAEQVQQQLRARVGTEQEGLRADVARLLRTLKDNHLPRSGAQDRLEAMAGELERLQREELGQIEPRLTEARKANEMGRPQRPSSDKDKEPLTEARRHQEEVEKTLGGLLKLLEPWSSSREVKGEAQSILRDQQKLREQTANLARQVPAGEERERLNAGQRAELEKAEELQKKLAERTDQLLDKLGRLTKEQAGRDAELSRQLQDAMSRGRDEKNNAVERMQQAAESIHDNQLAEAGSRQQESARAMAEVVKALGDRREEELDRLIKKMKDAEQKLAELSERQDRLQKKAQEARRMGDAAQREEQLKRLAREQKALQAETQDLLRELSRLRAQNAGEALSQAGGQMRQAAGRMQQGGDTSEQQKEALDRLNEARKQLQQARAEVEEELAREKLAKITDQLKGLRERQQGLTAEAARIHKDVLQRKKWERPLLASLQRLSESQADLATETEQLGKEKLADTKVFLRLLEKSAAAMKQASERMKQRLDQAQDRLAQISDDPKSGLDVKAEQGAEEETRRFQQAADRRIGQLLDAAKPEAGQSVRASGSPQGGQGQGGSGSRGRSADQLPPLSQIKALRALQEDVYQRTRDFARRHVDLTRLSDGDKEELQCVRQDQQEVDDLFQELLPREPEGGKK